MSDDADNAASPVVAEVAVDKPQSGSKPRKAVGGPAKKVNVSDNVKLEYGDIVLARLRGYPPWRESRLLSF